MKQHIFLCGMMGSGKTTVGMALAKKLELPFIDTDRWIQGYTQKTISQLFKEDGEDYFRQLEKNCINELKDNTKTVIGLGGGSLHPDMLNTIKKYGILIYLNSSINWLYEFIKDRKKRPLIMDENGQNLNEAEAKEKLNSLFNSRKDAYESAEIHIKTDQKSIDQIVNEISLLL